MPSAEEFLHEDGTVCVAGHDPATRQCAEGGGFVFPRSIFSGPVADRQMSRPDGPALIYVTAGTAPLVCRVDDDAFDPGSLTHWDRAVCRALLDLALGKIEQQEHQISTGVTQRPEADRDRG